MLRRSYISSVIAVLGLGAVSTQIEEQLLEERDKPHNWEKLGHKDKKNIRRYLRRRKRQDGSRVDLRLDLKNLVGMATMKTDGPLSTAGIDQFGGVTTRATRVIPQFLIFTGSETPRCPMCHNREYEPAENHPDQMRCKECSYLYTDRELATMVSPGF